MLTAAAMAAGLLATQGAVASNASGQMVAMQCNGCHGYNGASAGAIPTLKGLPADYLASAMKDFKSGKRPATIMNRIAKGYSDAEIDAVAEYYSELK
jgi:cytochrome c553